MSNPSRLPCLVAAAAGLLLVGLAGATPAPQETRRTLEQCAALLPPGQVYAFEITGNVDATGDAPVLSGQMSVSDGNEIDRSEETADFQRCLAALIR